MPGLINAHTHIPMVLFRGLADDLPLKIWLEENIFPVEAKLNKRLVAIGAELACAEMIRSGTTSFVDMYLFEDVIAEVTEKAGLRGWLGEGIFDFSTPAFPSGYEALKETQRLWDKWKGHDRITITVDPHTPYTCSRELLEESKKLALKLGAILVTHLAETDWEEEEIRKRVGLSPASYLDSLGILNEQLLAAHCVALNKQDIELLAARSVKVAHTPESNLKLGSGIAPLPDFLEQGICVALGTDGAASNNNLDLLSEMDTAAKLHKGHRKNPVLISASQALAMATTEGAVALHRDDLGHLSVDAMADIIIIDLDQMHLRPCFNPASQIVYSAKGEDVTDVIVNGKILMENRKLLTIDEQFLFSQLELAMTELGLGEKIK